jgi:hypothetical protein
MYRVGDELRNPQSPPCVTVLVKGSLCEGDKGEMTIFVIANCKHKLMTSLRVLLDFKPLLYLKSTSHSLNNEENERITFFTPPLKHQKSASLPP